MNSQVITGNWSLNELFNLKKKEKKPDLSKTLEDIESSLTGKKYTFELRKEFGSTVVMITGKVITEDNEEKKFSMNLRVGKDSKVTKIAIFEMKEIPSAKPRRIEIAGKKPPAKPIKFEQKPLVEYRPGSDITRLALIRLRDQGMLQKATVNKILNRIPEVAGAQAKPSQTKVAVH